MDITEELGSLPRPFVFALVTEVQGSAPGKAGFKMAVLADGSTRGTVGGGDIERQAIATAMEMLAAHQDVRVEKFALHPNASALERRTGMVCGGQASVYFERFPEPFRALLFGGGHVAQALAPLLEQLSFAVEIYDNRADYAVAARYPAASQITIGDYADLARQARLESGAFCFIFTHGHLHDRSVLEQLLARAQGTDLPCAYVGMIGSRRKVAATLAALQQQGVPEALLAQVRTPIGLDIGGSSPFEIAISICAEVLAIRYGKDAALSRAR